MRSLQSDLSLSGGRPTPAAAIESPPPRPSLEDDWQARLDAVYETMHEMSLQTDPQEMVRAYERRMQSLFPVDRMMSLSRRGLDYPAYRITRFSGWAEEIDPWKDPHRLPLLKGGLLSRLIYDGRPQVFDDLHVDESEPARRYLEGQSSLIAIPLLDHGESLNMVVVMRPQPRAFDRRQFPDQFWLANLFGRATSNLVLSRELKVAYEQIDRELQVVADIQRALLPTSMPEIPTLRLAASYQTSHHAGGDYYDIFPLPDGRWGLLIADVSGHGTPSAVVMAVTHSLVHLAPKSPDRPDELLTFVNRHLAERYTSHLGAFVTAFYGIYDPATRQLRYSSAGHNPPRVTRSCSSRVDVLSGGGGLPLGLTTDVSYPSEVAQLEAGDRLVLYTDGITEAMDPEGILFGVQRLDGLLQQCSRATPDELLRNVLAAVDGFTARRPATDDRTIVVGTVV